VWLGLTVGPNTNNGKLARTLIIVLLMAPLIGCGQSGAHAPMKVIVLKPDTAIIDKTLRDDVDSIEIAHLKSYYVCAKGGDAFEKDFSPSKYLTLESLKQNETFINLPPEVRQFKFFHLISEYSRQIYEFYFNQKHSPSEIAEMPSQCSDLNSLMELANKNNADYVIFFLNIHTVINDSFPVLRMTTLVYSRAEQELIVDKEIESNSINVMSNSDESSVMWNCNAHIKLQCLLINSVRSSTKLVSEILLRR
jgi:hypothetical protein